MSCDASEPAESSLESVPHAAPNTPERKPAVEPAGAQPSPKLSNEALAGIRSVLDQYEAIRKSVTSDSFDAVQKPASRIVSAAKEAAESAPAVHKSHLQAVEEAASALREDPQSVDEPFRDLSAAIVGLLQADPTLRRDWHLFECQSSQAGAAATVRWVQKEPEPSAPPFADAKECERSSWTG